MSVDITGADRSRWKWMYSEVSANTVAFIRCRGRQKLRIHPLSSWSAYSSDVYRHESGRCRSLLLSKIFYLSRFFFYINIIGVKGLQHVIQHVNKEQQGAKPKKVHFILLYINKQKLPMKQEKVQQSNIQIYLDCNVQVSRKQFF